MDDKLEKLIMITYERFPDYLFARIGLAGYYLNNDNPEKALEIIEGYNLKQLYPDRDVFHITEFRALEYFFVRFYCMEGNIKQAKIHYQNLEKILEDDDQILITAEEMIISTSRLHNFQSNLFKLIDQEK